MEPITLGIGIVVLAASVFGAGCKVEFDDPPKNEDPSDGGPSDDVSDDIPEEDGGVDAGDSGSMDAGVHDASFDAGSDASIPDAGWDGGPDESDGGDGGDAGIIIGPVLEERWTDESQCQIKGLTPLEQLYILCDGKSPRLDRAPLSQSIAPVVSENVVSFEEGPIPQIHTDIGNDFSVVTFNTLPDDKGSFTIIDRANSTRTETVALENWHDPVWEIDMVFPNPQGAMLFADKLLIAYSNGVVFEFPWNENGTINWDASAFYFLNATHKNPSLFLKKDEANAWLVNNGSLAENSPASIDKIDLHDFGAPPEGDAEEIRANLHSENNLLIGDWELNRLPALAANSDKSTVLLASGNLLIAVNLEAAEDENNISSLDLEGATNIVALQWYERNGHTLALASDETGQILVVRMEEGVPIAVETTIPVDGILGPSALDLSGCIFYQAYQIDGENSAVAAINCDIFEL